MKVAAKICNIVSIIGCVGAIAYVLLMRFTLCNICSSEDPANVTDAWARMPMLIAFPFFVASIVVSFLANKKLDGVGSKKEAMPAAIASIVAGVVMIGLAVLAFMLNDMLLYRFIVYNGDYLLYFILFVPILGNLVAGILMIAMDKKNFRYEGSEDYVEYETTEAEEYVEEETNDKE